VEKNMEHKAEYVELVREIQEQLDKTDRWGNLILNESRASLSKFLWTFSGTNQWGSDEMDTIGQREKRYRLLMHCPQHILGIALEHTDVEAPDAWMGFLHTPFEAAMRGCREGIDVDVSQLNDEQVVRCTIVKMTCMKRKAM